MAAGLEYPAFRQDSERPLGDVRIAEMLHSWSQRWERLKAELSLQDLLIDVAGKMLQFIGSSNTHKQIFRRKIYG